MSGEPTNTTAADVARWMVSELDRQAHLYQEEVVWGIQEKFGGDFVYYNEGGNLAISKKVLTEFHKLTPDVVWERGERLWRKRGGDDLPGRAAE
ncbi:MAG: hypothetical protein WD399_09100 [Thermoleophilaceae bacterium]